MSPRFLLPLLAFAAVARAQFYEPKTTAEDVAQRLFPVEAHARVLGWQHNLGRREDRRGDLRGEDRRTQDA